MLQKIRSKLHISWFIATICAGIVIGDGLIVLINFEYFKELSVLLLAILLALICFYKRSAFLITLALIAGILTGMWRGAIYINDLQSYKQLIGNNVQLQGVIAEDVTLGERSDQQLKLKDLKLNETSLAGTIWVSSRDKIELKRSDRITVEGKLTKGFGNMPATMFNARITNVQRIKLSDPGREVRDEFAKQVDAAITKPESQLAMGFLSGLKATLPQDLSDQLQLLGLTHIVVASGYNLTILVRFARRIFAKVSHYLSTAVSFTLITGFVLVTGFSPSMSRAALVTGISLLAWHYGRNVHPIILIVLVAAITLLIDPSSLWGDIGWYLSFTSFIGVVILAPLINKFFWAKKDTGSFRQIVIDTMSAQVMTLPIIALVFGAYSPLALPANLLILPLVPVAMALTFIAGLFTAMLPGLATYFGAPAQLILSYMTSVIEHISNIPFAAGDIKFTLTGLIISYAVLTLIIVALRLKTKLNFARQNIIK